MSEIPPKIPIRKLKKQVLGLLRDEDFETAMATIGGMPARQVINPLFSFLYSLDEQVKWRAVSAMGAVIAGLADSEIESARIIMRRFIWNLNDESGGIGWGSPEAMGETLALSDRMVEEYTSIFLSYIRPDGNYLEHPDLQRGVIWAAGRLARIRPELVEGEVEYLLPYLQTRDPILCGLVLWTLKVLPVDTNIPLLQKYVDDKRQISIYYEGRFTPCTIDRLARSTLSKQ